MLESGLSLKKGDKCSREPLLLFLQVLAAFFLQLGQIFFRRFPEAKGDLPSFGQIEPPFPRLCPGLLDKIFSLTSGDSFKHSRAS